ncbi:MAG: Na+/H+ antiporter NhaA [Owenweeksia sp.]|nr:Na+/H+ antiporter NhaA [Owenweeksia sp.]
MAGIGFTMSLFITELAFDNENYMAQAKVGNPHRFFDSWNCGVFIPEINGKRKAQSKNGNRSCFRKVRRQGSRLSYPSC